MIKSAFLWDYSFSDKEVSRITSSKMSINGGYILGSTGVYDDGVDFSRPFYLSCIGIDERQSLKYANANIKRIGEVG